MALNDSFSSLIADITEQVLNQVQQQVELTVTRAVADQIGSAVNDTTIKNIVNARIQETLSNYMPDTSIFDRQLEASTTNIINTIDERAKTQINVLVASRVNDLDFGQMLKDYFNHRLDHDTNQLPFREGTINGAAIDQASLKITGDNITGGVIKNFASTGIDDQASQCQVTVLDQGTVFENTLYAPRVEVKGGAVIDGDLTILGQFTDNPALQQLVAATSNQVIERVQATVLDAHQDRVFDRIQNEGLDLNKITINGKSIVENDRLTNAVLHSQLQTLGIVHDLQTEGEALLSQTLYVSNRRVGVNTMDPTTALSVWDEEIEIGIGKQSQGVARIAAARDHVLIIGSNKQDNITLTPDGVTEIPKLKLGNMSLTTAPTPPHYDAPRGSIVFNEQPNLGGPLGWVSLGDARWANFGIID
jgi:hypothetical protein